MKIKIDPNYKKSSNLVLITLGIIITNYLVSLMFFKEIANPLSLLMINLIVMGGVALIIRQGFSWSKYLSLLLLILYLVEFSLMVIYGSNLNLINLMVFAPQVFFVFWSTFMLFMKNGIKREAH